jgi:hypothetical protein
MAIKQLLKMPKITSESISDSVRAKIESTTRVRRDGTLWSSSPSRPQIRDSVPVKKEMPRALVATPTDEATQNNLASELLEWVKSDNAEALEQFPLERNMNPYKFYRIAEINPYFADCLEASASYLGFKMTKHARMRTQDGGVIMKLLPLYNKLYGDLVMQKSNAESTKVGTVIQVIESKVESSDMVPERFVSDN